jgi:lipoprotein-anchoring transpeptidase ErfK/SrfK
MPPGANYIAQATVPVIKVYDSPGAATPSREFPNPWFVNDDSRYPVMTVFLAEEQRNGWVRVLLPVRPNGSTGWVKESDVRLVPNRFRIEVDLSDRKLTVYDGDRVFLEDTVAIGKKETPTPVGKFFIRVLLKAPDPNTVYGPYAYGLSSHSEALEEFNGGDAEIGIHGNNDASLLGKDVSAGCIRMDNDKITRLTSVLPLGTAVTIRA